MSGLQRGDEHLHHADGSHRWSGGPADIRAREAYLASLRDHVEQHRAGFVAASRPRPERHDQARHEQTRHEQAHREQARRDQARHDRPIHPPRQGPSPRQGAGPRHDLPQLGEPPRVAHRANMNPGLHQTPQPGDTVNRGAESHGTAHRGTANRGASAPTQGAGNRSTANRGTAKPRHR